MFNKTGTPTPGSTAAVGAPTYTFKSDSDVVVAELNKTRPVVVLEFDFDTTSFSFIFNLFRPTSGFKTPRILVSAPSDNGQHYYYPGAAYADRQSGGTTAGGYNVRNENTWEVTWDNGYANWTYGYNPDQTVVPGLSTLRPSILIGLGIDDGIVYQPDQVGEGSISVVALMASNGECKLFGDTDLIVGSTSVDGANELSDLVPLPGDTTSSQVIVFSPVLYNDPIPQPTYPNYTLPDANLQVDPWDIILATHSTNSSNSLESNFPMGRDPVSMLIVQTEVSPIQHGLRNSGWAIVESAESYKNDPSTVIEEPDDTDTIWSTVGGQQGYRQIQVWTGLSPATNYTVWAMSATFTLSQPAFFVTKHGELLAVETVRCC
jgi:calcium channel MID1